MKLLIKNAAIITMEERDKVIRDGYVSVVDDKIGYVGETMPGDFIPDVVIDGKNRAVLPGFVNAHSHSPMVLMRCIADDLCLQDWLFKKIFPIEARLSEEDVYWGSLLGIMEMLSSGVTSFFDMYFFMNGVAKAVSKAGIRACLSTGINNLEKNTDYARNSYIVENRRLFEEWNGAENGKITVYLGPHSVYTCEPEMLSYITELSHQLGSGIHIHISETLKENEECVAKYRKTPVGLLNQIGLFSTNTIAAHCVHISDEDMDILKRNNVTIAYNPSSNLKLGSGITPVKHIMQKGINIALGTDGASSNNNLNMFEEINLAAIVSKGVEMDPTLVNSYEAVRMATVNGARALGKEKDLGMVRPGMKADLIMINLDKLHFYPLHNIISGMAYSAQAADVETVIVDGKILMENREFKTIDREQVVYNIKRIAHKIGSHS